MHIQRNRIFYRYVFLNKIIIILSIVITYQWGITNMIIGQFIAITASYIFNTYFSGKSLRYNFFQQIYDIFPYLFLSIIMGVGIYQLKYIFSNGSFMLLFIQIISGIIFYGLLCHIFKMSSFVELYQIIKSKFLSSSITNL